MTRRRKYSDSENDFLQKLKKENDRLKKQISSLRKQLARIDIHRHENLKQLLEKHSEEDLQQKISEEKQILKKRWQCHNCTRDYLRLTILDRRDGIWYYRNCPACNHKTKLKKWHKDVEGVE